MEDDKKATQTLNFYLGRVEIIVGKVEPACYQQFLLLKYFPKLSFSGFLDVQIVKDSISLKSDQLKYFAY